MPFPLMQLVLMQLAGKRGEWVTTSKLCHYLLPNKPNARAIMWSALIQLERDGLVVRGSVFPRKPGHVERSASKLATWTLPEAVAKPLVPKKFATLAKTLGPVQHETHAAYTLVTELIGTPQTRAVVEDNINRARRALTDAMGRLLALQMALGEPEYFG